jgi:mono/diheme cytochrome c family protein
MVGRFSTVPRSLQLVGLVAALAVATGALAATPPRVIGNAKAGKAMFVSTCGVCHQLKAAASVGNIGPNLDRVRLTEATIVKAITDGGATVMTKAELAKYATQMVAYSGVLSAKVIQNVAAFVYVSTHPG